MSQNEETKNDPNTTPFGGAVGPRLYRMIPFDERAEKDAAARARAKRQLKR